eukprot:comp22713_c0_seq1/m.35271 comp22713_c0_seq1/g.35271  ORF comp22713_c0_seq1/g.35271 comp22713_c0_seq1/m.35271 type:complete len:530 (-) comp22713_c0_seq1:880-2469(-)
MSNREEDITSSSSGEEEVPAEGEWEDWQDENDEPEEATRCLLCPQTLSSAQLALKHCVDAHQFDFVAYVRSKRLDFYQIIKLVNYLRKNTTSDGTKPILPEDISAILSDDALLQPVIPNDGLLMFDFDVEEGDDDDDEPPPLATDDGKQKSVVDVGHVDAVIAEDSGVTKEAYQQMRATMQKLLTEGDAETGPSGVPVQNLKEQAKEEDEYYVDSYSNVAIHEEMLRDVVRTEAYRDFMYKNPELLKDKVVLDVGCGTGILSMFAARAGAKKVIGIDFSSVAEQAKLNVAENGLDHIVTIIRGKVEEVVLPVNKVDIIISEWMGYFLLFEAMFNTVLWARDRWLAPGGLVHPDQATMYITGFEDQGRLSFWNDVYGFKMSAMREMFSKDSSVEVVPGSGIITSKGVLADFNMCTLKVGETEFSKPFHLLVTRAGHVHALMSYFDIIFEAGCKNTVFFSTGPEATPTHWKQTLFYLPEAMTVEPGQSVVGKLTCRTDTKKLRGLVVDIEYGLQDSTGSWVVPLKEKRYFV